MSAPRWLRCGFYGLLNSDGVDKNIVNGALVGVGVLVAVVGWAMWRFPRLGRHGPVAITAEVGRLTGFGLVAIALGVVIAAAADPESGGALGVLVSDSFGRTLLAIGIGLAGILAIAVAAGKLTVWWPLAGMAIAAIPAVGYLMTRQGARAVLFVGLVVVGLIALLVAGRRAAMTSASAGLVVELLTAVVVAGVAFFIRSQSDVGEVPRRAVHGAAPRGPGPGLLGAPRLPVHEPHDGGCGGRLDGPAGRRDRRRAHRRRHRRPDAVLDRRRQPRSPASSATAISILWFILFAIVGSLVLMRTRFGNWIFAVGGNKEAARAEGVPAARTKTTLFMIVSGAAWLSGMLVAFRLNSVQANVGDGLEFEYIIAAVVGGNLLTGGYGSAAGAAIGSLIMAMSTQGIPFAGWNTNWRYLLLGVILLLAVIANNYVRNKAASR